MRNEKWWSGAKEQEGAEVFEMGAFLRRFCLLQIFVILRRYLNCAPYLHFEFLISNFVKAA